MSLPKTESRRLVVNGVAYRWMASGNDDCILLYVQLELPQGQLLIAHFDYDPERTEVGGDVWWRQRRQITPQTACQTVEAALRNGWQPSVSGLAPFELWRHP